MVNDFCNGFTSAHSARQFQEQERMTREANQKQQRALNDLDVTANNTALMSERMQNVIRNQNDYIELLKQQIEIYEQQLKILKNIFASNEDSAAVEKEIFKLIRDQIDDQHPMWDYVKDKAGDIAVVGITTGAPIIFNAFKAYLAKNGIILP